MAVVINGSGPVTGVTTLASPTSINGLTLPTDSLQPGLVLLNKTDFSGAATVSVNNCFTSTYENYMIVWKGTPSASLVGLFIRLRSAGADITNSVYSYTSARLYVDNAIDPYSFGASTVRIGNGGIASWPTFHQVNVYSPNIAAPTGFTADGANRESANAAVRWWAAGFHDSSTAYDGFTMYPASGPT